MNDPSSQLLPPIPYPAAHLHYRTYVCVRRVRIKLIHKSTDLNKHTEIKLHNLFVFPLFFFLDQ